MLICCSRNSLIIINIWNTKAVEYFLFWIIWWIEISNFNIISDSAFIWNNVMLIIIIKKIRWGWLWKLILLFSKEIDKKVMIKTCIKISISDKCCSSELSIHQRNQKKIRSCFQHNNNKCWIFEWFLKDRVTGLMILKMNLWNHRNKCHF